MKQVVEWMELIAMAVAIFIPFATITSVRMALGAPELDEEWLESHFWFFARGQELDWKLTKKVVTIRESSSF
jgi:hypothetical protein